MRRRSLMKECQALDHPTQVSVDPRTVRDREYRDRLPGPLDERHRPNWIGFVHVLYAERATGVLAQQAH